MKTYVFTSPHSWELSNDPSYGWLNDEETHAEWKERLGLAFCFALPHDPLEMTIPQGSIYEFTSSDRFMFLVSIEVGANFHFNLLLQNHCSLMVFLANYRSVFDNLSDYSVEMMTKQFHHRYQHSLGRACPACAAKVVA